MQREPARSELAVLSQVLGPGGGYRDERAASRLVTTHYEAPVVGLLPHRDAWTRGSPGIEYLGVGAWSRPDPLQEVENQGVNGAGHSGVLCTGIGAALASGSLIHSRGIFWQG
jgi:hypothetical protein